MSDKAGPAVPWKISGYLASVILSRLALVAVIAFAEMVFVWLQLRVPIWLGIQNTDQARYAETILGVMSIVFDIAAIATVVVTGAFDVWDAYRERHPSSAQESGE